MWIRQAARQPVCLRRVNGVLVAGPSVFLLVMKVSFTYHNDLGFVGGDSDTWATLGVAEVDPEHAGNKMRELGKSFGLPVAVGPAEIGAFYRRLYRS